MSSTFERAVQRHGLHSREAFLELASLTGHRCAGTPCNGPVIPSAKTSWLVKCRHFLSRATIEIGRDFVRIVAARPRSFEMNDHVISHAPERAPGDRAPDMSEAHALIEFWREAGPNLWFAKNPEFDERFRARFLDLHQAAAGGALNAWLESPEGALALVLLLDQFPRNAFRGDARMYATDDTARAVADEAIGRGHDRMTAPDLRIFFYLPFAHSERVPDQDRAVALAATLGEESRRHAEHHRDIILRFGCFPHRNAILGRASTPAQDAYLANGGFAG